MHNRDSTKIKGENKSTVSWITTFSGEALPQDSPKRSLIWSVGSPEASPGVTSQGARLRFETLAPLCPWLSWWFIAHLPQRAPLLVSSQKGGCFPVQKAERVRVPSVLNSAVDCFTPSLYCTIPIPFTLPSLELFFSLYSSSMGLLPSLSSNLCSLGLPTSRRFIPSPQAQSATYNKTVTKL